MIIYTAPVAVHSLSPSAGVDSLTLLPLNPFRCLISFRGGKRESGHTRCPATPAIHALYL